MTSFTNIFGGGVINPTVSSYVSFSLTAQLATAWPLETNPNTNILGQITEIAATSTGPFGIILPSAALVSVGQFLIINNLSAFTQPIYDNSGTTIIASVLPGAIYFLYVTVNTSAAGTWNAFQYGAQASAPSVSGLAGPGLLAVGSTLAQDIPITSLNSPFSVGVSNRAQMFNWTGGSGTITLPLAATVQGSYYIQVRNSGTSILTVATVGSDVINGATTVAFNPGDSCFIVTDGTSWYTLGFGPILTANFNFIVINVPSVIVGSIVTLSGTQLNQIAYRFTGALTANTIVDLPAVKQQYWIDNETTGAFSLTFQIPTTGGGATPAGSAVAVPQGQRIILYTDGTNVLNASTAGISIPLAVNQGGTGATSAGAALINLGGSSQGIALFTSTTVAAAQTALAVPSFADAYLMASIL